MNYQDYYDNQIGGGRHYKIFVGAPYQKGHGIGSFLGGLFRAAIPLIRNGAVAVGQEALSTGMSVAADMALRRVPLKESLKARLHESTSNLKRKADNKIDTLMQGSGYKRAKKTKRSHSRRSRGKKRKPKKKLTHSHRRSIKKRKSTKKNKHRKERTVADIFA